MPQAKTFQPLIQPITKTRPGAANPMELDSGTAADKKEAPV
jgi:hypothetical protein